MNPESKRGIVLGEGKPENQNHAIIFCHNEALQSIDMNQVRRPHKTSWASGLPVSSCIEDTASPCSFLLLTSRRVTELFREALRA